LGGWYLKDSRKEGYVGLYMISRRKGEDFGRAVSSMPEGGKKEAS